MSGNAFPVRPGAPVTLDADAPVRAQHRGLLLGIALLLAFSVLAFGGVYEWGLLTLQLGAGVLFAAWAFSQLQAGEVAVARSPLYGPALGFAALVAAQLLFRRSAYAFATRAEALNWIAYGLLAFLAVQCLEERRQRNRVLRGLALFGAAVAAFAILQKLAPNGRIYWFWPTNWPTLFFGPYINHAHYSGLMEMLAPAALVLALRRSQSLETRLLWGGAAVVMISSVFISLSRGGMVAIIVELLVLGWYLARAERLRQGLLGLAVIASLAFLLVAWLDNGDLLRRLGSIPSLEREGATSATRLTIARDTLRLAAQRPVAGWGLGTFADVYPQFRSFPTELLIDHAHNDYLEMLAETGALGALLTLWFLAGVFRGARDALAHWHFRDSGGALTLASLVGVAGLLAHSLTDFNLHIPANAALFFVLCAAAAFRPENGTVTLPAAFAGRASEPRVILDAEPDLQETASDPD